MVAIGEESGSIDACSTRSPTTSKEVDSTVIAMTSLIELMIIAFLGIVIGDLVVGMYLPIFKMAMHSDAPYLRGPERPSGRPVEGRPVAFPPSPTRTARRDRMSDFIYAFQTNPALFYSTVGFLGLFVGSFLQRRHPPPAHHGGARMARRARGHRAGRPGQGAGSRLGRTLGRARDQRRRHGQRRSSEVVAAGNSRSTSPYRARAARTAATGSRPCRTSRY